MTNTELELKVKEILQNDNMFDLIENAVAFEREYKQSDFYRNTKLPFMEVIKYGKVFYSFNIKEIVTKAKNYIQSMIEELDFSKVNELINQFGDMFANENGEIRSQLEELSGLQELFK